MNFTPGEWKLTQSESGSLVIESGLRIIGQTSRASTPEEAQEIQANAQLISAAPDMYKALEDALDDIISEYPEDWASIKTIRAALAKAEGK